MSNDVVVTGERPLGVYAYTPSVDMNAFRTAFTECRLQSGLTQKQLSELTKAEGLPAIGVQAVSDIETGATKDPGTLTISRLIEAMGLTVSAFFLQMEHTTIRDIGTGIAEVESAASPQRNPSEAAAYVSGSSTRADPFKIISDALIGAAATIAKASTAAAARPHRAKSSRTRSKKSGPRRRSA